MRGLKQKWFCTLLTMLFTMTLVVQLPVQAANEGAQPDEIISAEMNSTVADTDEFGCHLRPWHTCYKYEYAYRTGDTSGLDAEDMDFYEGLKGYLDYAYQFDTPYEQEKAIHDYMVLNCVYAEGHYIDGQLSNDVWDYDGVFRYGQAVCQGYAVSFKLCMDILGIESQVILGNTPEGKHAWNAVKLDGEWYWVDVTWDDPVPDVEGQVRYLYFNVPRWWMDVEHTTGSAFDVEGTKYSADEVLMLTVGQEQNQVSQMMARHVWNMSKHTVLRVYVEKADGSVWTREEVEAYRLPVSMLYNSAYNGYRFYSFENGSQLCYTFQGWGSTAEVLMEYLISVGVLAGMVAVVVIAVRKLRKRRKRKEEQAEGIKTI